MKTKTSRKYLWFDSVAALTLGLFAILSPLALTPPSSEPHPPLTPFASHTAVLKASVRPPVTAPEPSQSAQALPPLKTVSTPHPQYRYEALSAPTQPVYTTEPFLGRISAAAAWESAVNSNAGPTIAVVDTGFALNHELLASRFVPGWDFVHGDATPNAGQDNPSGSGVGHGTLTAGLAGLMNPDAKIMPLQALDDTGVGYTDDIANAVRYAADHGAKIISMSLGSTADDPYLHEQIDYAIGKGAVVLAAAGNDGCDCMRYPAAYPEVVSVGASDSSDNRASFSSYGSNLDVMAPGTAGDVCSSIYTTTNSTTAYTCSYSGTSLSTPIVSGLAALVLQQIPDVTPGQIQEILERSADKVAGMGGAFRTAPYGYGRIDSASAVSNVIIPLPSGQFYNKDTASLSSNTLAQGPIMDTTCVGRAGGTCTMELHGPSGQVINLGTQSLDDRGGTDFPWNAATLNLTPGSWTIVLTVNAAGQNKSTTSQTVQISS